jgi:hypothetical protein
MTVIRAASTAGRATLIRNMLPMHPMTQMQW